MGIKDKLEDLTMKLIAIETVGPRSISDDDVCATCRRCEYAPGEVSDCKNGWPGLQDSEGYVRECQDFDAVEYPEENWVLF